MAISEIVDLDIDAALAKIKRLETALNKASSAGTSGGVSGLGTVAKDAKTAETAVGGLGKVTGDLRSGLAGLAQTAAGQLSPSLSGAAGILKDVGEAAGSVAGPLLAIGAGAVVVGLALGKMALDGVGKFTSLADSIRHVQQVSGATAEDASRLVAVGNALGVNADSTASAFFRLSQNIQKHASTLEADGVSIAKNSKGGVDLSATLLNVSDAYIKAGKGAAGNKVLFDSFGRSGAALIPILAAGRDKLNEFFDEADKHHEILSQADLDKAKAYQIATHDLSEAFSGFERELGSAVIPALIIFSKFLTDEVEGFDKTVHGIGRVVGGLHDFVFGHQSAAAAAKANNEVVQQYNDTLTRMSQATGVATPRIEQLAQSMGVDLSNATASAAAKVAAAADKLNAAVTPTQHLAAATDVLSSSVSTASENVRAYTEAIDGTLGALLNSQQSAITLRSSIQGLANDYATGRTKGESYQEFQDKLQGGLIGVTQNIEKMGDSLVHLGSLSTDGSTRNAFLTKSLQGIADKFPELRSQIGLYEAQILSVPTTHNTVFTADVTQALANIKLVLKGVSATESARLKAQFIADQGKGPYSQTVIDQLGPAYKKAADTVSSAFAKSGSDAADQFIGNLVKQSEGNLSKVTGAASKAGAAAAAAVSLGLSSKAGGLDIGGFIVAGIQLGAAKNQVLANNAALGLIKGMKDVVAKAQLIDPTEQLGILDAVKNLDSATKQLQDDRKKFGATSIEVAVDEAKLKQAQADVNTKTLAAIDATSSVTEQLKKQKEAQALAKSGIDAYNKAIQSSYTGLLGALTATRGLVSAQQALRDAQQAVVDVQTRQAELPGEIAAADQALAQAQATSANDKALAEVQARQTLATAQAKVSTTTADATATDLDKLQATLELNKAQTDLMATLTANLGPTQAVASATAALKTLTDEQAAIARKLSDANNSVEDATLGVVAAQKAIIDQSAALGNATDKASAFFAALGASAGLSAGQINGLLAALASAQKAVGAGMPGSPLVAQPVSDDPFLNTTTGRQAYTGPGGEAGSASKQAIADYAKAHGINPALIQHSNVGGVGAYYIPGVAVDPGNLGAIANLSQMPAATPNVSTGGTRTGGDVTFHAADTPSITANFYPQTAVFDESTAGAYLQNLELLYS